MSEFRMPSLGADMDSGVLLEWLVKPGDRVTKGDSIAVVDTDKAAVEVETFTTGVVKELRVEPGTRVPVGTPLATLSGEDELANRQEPTPPSEARDAAPRPQPGLPPQRRLNAAPPVRQLAARLGVDLATVHGTGRAGAVTHGDVERAAHARPAPTRPRVTPYARRLAAELGVDPATVHPRGADLVVRARDVRATAAPPASREPQATGRAEGTDTESADRTVTMRAAIARSMSRSKREIPHYYLSTTIDLAGAQQWLRQQNRDRPVSSRVVPAALLMKATATAAHRFPDLNGLYTDGAYQPGASVHLGVAVALRGGGLVAPALRDAQGLDLDELMARLRDLVTRARQGRLRRTELADPSITVTNLGDQGVESVHGVIYPPQVALVGFGRIVDRPWAVDGLLGIRPTVTATLAADHRVSDGYTGARFLAALDSLLQRPEEL